LYYLHHSTINSNISDTLQEKNAKQHGLYQRFSTDGLRPGTGRGRFQTGRGLPFFHFELFKFTHISQNFSIVEFLFKNTGRGAIRVERRWPRSGVYDIWPASQLGHAKAFNFACTTQIFVILHFIF